MSGAQFLDFSRKIFVPIFAMLIVSDAHADWNLNDSMPIGRYSCTDNVQLDLFGFGAAKVRPGKFRPFVIELIKARKHDVECSVGANTGFFAFWCATKFEAMITENWNDLYHPAERFYGDSTGIMYGINPLNYLVTHQTRYIMSVSDDNSHVFMRSGECHLSDK